MCSTHNETVNIWTHLIGSTVAVLTLIYCAVAIQGEGRSNATRLGWAAAVTVIQPFPSASQPSVTWMDSLGFIVFFLSAATCLGFSATFHILHSHSMHVSHYWNRLDYVGIVVLVRTVPSPTSLGNTELSLADLGDLLASHSPWILLRQTSPQPLFDPRLHRISR